LWWSLNFVVHGGGWCSNKPLGHMGWGYGSILGGVGESSLVILDLRWEIAPRLISGMIWCGDMALMEVFSDLYGIACANDAFVVAHLEISGGSNQ
jgi:hypothetical protein